MLKNWSGYGEIATSGSAVMEHDKVRVYVFPIFALMTSVHWRRALPTARRTSPGYAKTSADAEDKEWVHCE